MNKIDVKHIAKLANLTITSEQESKFESQLSEVLEMVGKLNEVDTTGVKETSQVTGLENITREDVARPSLAQEDALSNASAQHNGLFMVKGIFDEE
jgi:aspartyl-tRNA(Asn)/glutamyl-tRNA(Gln) amidotransferase subunit C